LCSSGFQIFAAVQDGYLVRRISELAVLSRIFSEAEVRLDPVLLPPKAWSPGDAV